MIEIMKKIAFEAIQSMSPLVIEAAEVVSSPPNIELRFKDNQKLVIPSELIIVSEHLTNHTREIRLDEDEEIQSYEFVDELKIGDQVMVAAIQGGQSFFIIDRYVQGG
ncbi:DUF2577 domain-containing protein [Heyndrickxia sp. NPDC080065]|uniref:DUF2577 domain-containing protein n=1 Tax=Heyndrickxia sp. NPDC080065 TaxID=3390568 RepID=UPI003D09235C